MNRKTYKLRMTMAVMSVQKLVRILADRGDAALMVIDGLGEGLQAGDVIGVQWESGEVDLYALLRISEDAARPGWEVLRIRQ